MPPINTLIISMSATIGVIGVVSTQAPVTQPVSPAPVIDTTRFEVDYNNQDVIKLEQMTWESTQEVINQQNREALKAQIDAYKNTYFPSSPVTSDMIINVSEHYGVPVGFILAVGHSESHMGTKGRAVETRNPMNVGNVTEGDHRATNCTLYSNCLSGWEEGLDQFASLISRCYFHENEVISLQTWMDRDFRAVRCGLEGKRYMTNPLAYGKYQERINNLKQFNIKY